MHGELRWKRYGHKTIPFVYYAFDAEECESVAACMSSNDEWAVELVEDAEELRNLMREEKL